MESRAGWQPTGPVDYVRPTVYDSWGLPGLTAFTPSTTGIDAMTSRAVIKWTVRACAVGAALLLFGCSSGKPYALVAQIGSGAHLVVGTIEVSDGQCHARFASLDWADFYNPDCKIMKDQSGFKSFDIDGKQIDFGAVDN